ncbi:ATP-dependent DNA helicase Q1-like [Saccostrea echinata]|uniref:ATP-dependent DNA helicase Q1-like n=1 Tax=Saccostrea echinata TaxID=191078 RepID=UPI002A83DE98|nr:ATP-dependent DNA helicase Q1-like [Saccostrea echinata]
MASFEDCVAFATKSMGLEFSLKDKQLETLRALFIGHDCVSVMPTGYGKSVIFQCLPWLFQRKRGLQHPLITLVVSLLTSLMQDQVMTLCEKGIKACFLNCEGMYPWNTYILRCEEEYDDSDDDQDKTDVHVPSSTSLIDLKRGEYNIIYAHPETLLNNRKISSMLRSKLYLQRVCAVVIDEVHTVSDWARGLSFRKAFKKLSELVCIFPTSDTVHLAMTATAIPTAIKELVDDLQFTDVTIITVNPDRPNIKVEIQTRLPNIRKYEKLDELLHPVAQELRDLLSCFPLTIVYINQLEALGYCYQYIEDFLGKFSYFPVHDPIPENRLFAQFHKVYTSKMKAHIVSELRKEKPTLR